MFEIRAVRELMTSPAITVTPETLLSAVHELMSERHIRRLPVMDEAGKLVGIVTIGDVREASPSDVNSLSIWEMHYLWAKLTVEEVMTPRVITIEPDASVVDAAELMLKHKIGGLPVVDETGKVTGILTESDVFKMLVEARVEARSS